MISSRHAWLPRKQRADAFAAGGPRGRLPSGRLHHACLAQDARLRGLSDRRSAGVGAEPLYRVDDGHYQFKYLPAFALLAAPLGLMPLAIAKALWFAVSAVLMVVLLWLSALAISPPRRPLVLLVVITFLAMAKFYAHELVLGQVNLLFAVVVMLAVVQMRRGREVRPASCSASPSSSSRTRRCSRRGLPSGRGTAAFVAMLATVVDRAARCRPCAMAGREIFGCSATGGRRSGRRTAPNLLNQDNVSLAAMFTKWLGPDSAAPALRCWRPHCSWG